MSEIDEEGIKQWGLTFSDLISRRLQASISFRDFESEEIIYSEFLSSIEEPHWVTLCEDKNSNESILIAMNYTSVMASTNNFFSVNPAVTEEINKPLSYAELFIAEEISKQVMTAFKSSEFDMKFIRNEPQINLVKPFHDDDSITIYKFKWSINDETYGELKVCHSHVL